MFASVRVVCRDGDGSLTHSAVQASNRDRTCLPSNRDMMILGWLARCIAQGLAACANELRTLSARSLLFRLKWCFTYSACFAYKCIQKRNVVVSEEKMKCCQMNNHIGINHSARCAFEYTMCVCAQRWGNEAIWVKISLDTCSALRACMCV